MILGRLCRLTVLSTLARPALLLFPILPVPANIDQLAQNSAGEAGGAAFGRPPDQAIGD